MSNLTARQRTALDYIANRFPAPLVETAVAIELEHAGLVEVTASKYQRKTEDRVHASPTPRGFRASNPRPCDGDGVCRECDGDGESTRFSNRYDDCLRCNGSGSCPVCEGDGCFEA